MLAHDCRQLRLRRPDYASPTITLARDLLGKLIVRQLAGQRLSGIIVEVEAYLAENDPASHSHRGLNRKNAAMFMDAGTLYVYPIHAKHCLNVVSEPAGIGAAVLIRAIQPWDGLEQMQRLRNTTDYRLVGSGPARLCQALAIDRTHDQQDLITSEEIWIEKAPIAVAAINWQVTASPRIGISQAKDLPYRWFIDGHQCVSGLARFHSQRRHWMFRANA